MAVNQSSDPVQGKKCRELGTLSGPGYAMTAGQFGVHKNVSGVGNTSRTVPDRGPEFLQIP